MWSEAIEMLVRAERLRHQFFMLRQGHGLPSWEPPTDVFETGREVIVMLALPGVDPQGIEAVIEDGALVISGDRALPTELTGARIHRLELPLGRFERRVELPVGRYVGVVRQFVNSCLVIHLPKV
jgi:HSP20 family protein